MQDMFIGDGVISEFDTQQTNQNCGEIASVRMTLVERHGSVQDAGRRDEHRGVIGCEPVSI